jgi:hypothetical protein
VELRELVDHLARRGVAWIAVTQGEETLEIGLRPVVSPAAAVTPPPGRIVTAQGPGLFHPRHPDSGAGMPCLEAGDFLFPVAGPVAGEEGDEVLAAAGAVVGYGTPLLRRTRTA